jgi:DNA-binding Xre family transcriptional regulator
VAKSSAKQKPTRGRRVTATGTTRLTRRPSKRTKLGKTIRSNPHEGSTLDDFLREEGLYEQATRTAIKETIAWQLERAMELLHLTKTEMAARMGTSRAALDRLLDPANESVTLGTLIRAADALGLKLHVALRAPTPA